MTGQALPIRRWNSARGGTVPTKAARHKSRAAFLIFRYEGPIAMVERREPKPMEIQSFHSETDGAKPMASVPSKRGRAPRTTARAIARSQADTTRKRSLKKQRGMLQD
jgi:hypothetical protein